MVKNRPLGAGSSPIPPDDRSNPDVRKRLAGPALRTFFKVAKTWEASTEEQRGLLGYPPESTFFKYKKGDVPSASFDTLTRVSLVLGIFKALRILYPERSLADRWVRLPNSNRLFGGEPPIAFMTRGGMDALYQVRRLLDARRGGWN
jgi:hypothetical protein